jgi:hypothetical protein
MLKIISTPDDAVRLLDALGDQLAQMHDPSEGYRMALEQALAALGVADAALGA